MADSLSPALLVAALDLSLVRMLRQAMRVADTAAGSAANTLAGSAVASASPQPQASPAPHFHPRPQVHPTPRFEPRLVYRPTTIEPRLIPPPGCSQAAPAEEPHTHKMPIEPPWKLLPWQAAVSPTPKLKLVNRHPDVVNRGTLLDVFI